MGLWLQFFVCVFHMTGYVGGTLNVTLSATAIMVRPDESQSVTVLAMKWVLISSSELSHWFDITVYGKQHFNRAAATVLDLCLHRIRSGTLVLPNHCIYAC